MRRWIVFVLVFGAGLAALLWFDRLQREGQAERVADLPADQATDGGDGSGASGGSSAGQPSTGSSASGETPGDTTARPPADVQDTEGFEVTAGGRWAFTSFDQQTGLKSLELVSENLVDLGDGLYDAHALTIDSFDGTSGQPVRAITIEAERGRLQLDVGARVALRDDGRIELFDVVVTQHVGGALAPLVFRAPRLVAWIELDRFESVDDDVASVEGVGLRADGRGLVVEGATERFEFRRGGTVTLERAGEEPIELVAPSGPLVVRRDEAAAAERLFLEADGGATIGLRGEPATAVAGRRLELETRRTRGDEHRLVSGQVIGEVVTERGGDRFESGRAEMRFDEVGELRELELFETPHVELNLEDEDGRPLLVIVDGDGPLVLETTAATRFSLAGASRVTTPADDLSVRCTGGLEGWLVADEEQGEFDARGDVVLENDGLTLRTDALHLSVPGDQAEAFDATCEGRTVVVGADEAGVEYSLTAERGFELRRRGEDWLVPVARGVVLEPTEEGTARRVTMGVMRDLDWNTQSFRGEEGVRIESEDGEADAWLAIVRGPEDLELFGRDEERARLALRDGRGTVHARRIRGFPDRVELEGDAELEMSDLGRSWSVRAANARVAVRPNEADPSARSNFLFEAREVTRAELTDAGGSTVLSCDYLWVPGTFLTPEEDPGDVRDVEGRSLNATGSVVVSHSGRIELEGQGERFRLEPTGRAVLTPAPGGRIRSQGRLEDAGLPFDLTGTRLAYRSAIIEVDDPHVVLNAVLLPISPVPLPATPGERVTEAFGDHLEVDKTGITLTGDVRLVGHDEGGAGLTVEAQRVKLAGQLAVEGEVDARSRGFQAIDVSGGFVARYALNAMARGERMYATQDNVHIEGEPAQVKVSGLSLESSTLDVDLESYLIEAPRGILRATGEAGEWSFAFASMTPVEEEAEDMIVFGAPQYSSGPTSGARAEWAVMWIHADSWRERASALLWGREPTGLDRLVPMPLPVEDLLPNVFRSVQDRSFGRYLRALYVEGDIEMTELGERVARAGAVYLDLAEARGWMREAEVVFDLDVGSKREVVRTRMEELTTASDGSLRADLATLTTCSHEEPHYVVETGGLRLEPRSAGGWRVSARDNMLRFAGGLQIPLPPLGDAVLDRGGDFEGFETDDDEVYEVDRIGLGSTARFGTSVGAGIKSDIGSWGKGVSTVFGFDSDEVRGRWDLDASYLGARGVLYDIGLKLSQESRMAPGERKWLHLYTSGISDDKEDKGIIRVDPDERDSFRGWHRARGRYPTGDKAWFDLAFTTQSDPGVQSEFFQRRFLRWEERDNFLHWRKGIDSDLITAQAKFRVDDYRTEVERRPALGFYRGAREFASLFDQPILYGARFDLENLRRKPGDPLYEAIFEDAHTGRSAVRADTVHRVEAPIPTGVAAIQATPFVEGRFTAWDEGFDRETEPYRGVVLAGVELSTTFWKELRRGFVHDFTPSARLTRDVVHDEEDGIPIEFDAVEASKEGTELDLGVRSRWLKPGTNKGLDLELRGKNYTDRPDGLEDTWELFTLATLHSELGNWPIAVTHDGRVDLEEERTLFSRTRFGFSPAEPLVIELGYSRGATLEERLFEAASIQARWTMNDKWEIEGKQTINVAGGGNFNTSAILRRYSHDYFLELGTDYQEGEGSSFTITWRPLLGYREEPIGLIRR